MEFMQTREFTRSTQSMGYSWVDSLDTFPCPAIGRRGPLARDHELKDIR